MADKSSGVKLSDLLIATLFSARNTRRFKEIIRERQLCNYKERSIRTTLYRLEKEGYVLNSKKGWFISRKGKNRNYTDFLFSYIPSPFPTDCVRNTILAFDIPEKNRKVRNWIRNQIKIYNYEMLQQSLWIGPGPLPKEFLKRLEDLKIRKCVKIFRVARE